MVDILHRVGIKSSTQEVYKALTTREGKARLAECFSFASAPMSLKSLVESGKASPNPNDPHISGDGPD